MSFYDDIAAKANELLTKYGTSFDHGRYDQSNVYSSVDATKQGLIVPITVENTPQSLIETTKAVLFSTVGSVEFDKNDYVTFDGTLYSINDFELIKPTTKKIIYKVYLTK